MKTKSLMCAAILILALISCRVQTQQTPDVLPPSVMVRVDGTKTIKQLMSEGSYKIINPIMESGIFPIVDSTKRNVVVEIVQFPNDFRGDIRMGIDTAIFRHATIEEILSLWAQHPDYVGDRSIVALGSVAVDTSVNMAPIAPSIVSRYHGLGVVYLNGFGPGVTSLYSLYSFIVVRK